MSEQEQEIEIQEVSCGDFTLRFYGEYEPHVLVIHHGDEEHPTTSEEAWTMEELFRALIHYLQPL